MSGSGHTSALLLVAACMGIVAADDVATTMYRNNPAGTGELIGAVEFESLELAWSHRTELTDPSQYGHLVPIVGDGRIYYAATGGIECLDAFSGSVQWTVRDDDLQFRPAGVGSRYNGVGHVVSLCGETLLVPTDNGKMLGRSTKDGSLKWTFRSTGWITNAVIVDQVAYFTDGKGLVALNCADGKLAWRFDPGSPPEQECMVVVADDGVYFATQNGKLHKVSLDRRAIEWSAVLWQDSDQMVNGTFCCKNGELYVSTISLDKHYGAAKRLLKINAADGEIIASAPIGSDRTRTGLQTNGEQLIVFGLHNPGCVSTQDLQQSWRIRRAATSPSDIANSYDMQYGGATIVGGQIMYVNYLTDAPFWVTNITNGKPLIRVRKPGDEKFTTRAFRAPSGYFKSGTTEGWMYYGAGGGILGLKGTCVHTIGQ